MHHSPTKISVRSIASPYLFQRPLSQVEELNSSHLESFRMLKLNKPKKIRIKRIKSFTNVSVKVRELLML